MKAKNALRVALLIGAGMALGFTHGTRADDTPQTRGQAVAIIHGAGENKDKIKGTAAFIPNGNDSIKIVVDVHGLTPGEHGIHIHEKSDLSAPDLKSAGGHFNPGGGSHHHGGPDDTSHHAGDLGNITADAEGHGHLELVSHDLTIQDAKTGVVGHSIIIHAQPDDLKTDPAGNSGARIAGGAIIASEAGGRQPN